MGGEVSVVTWRAVSGNLKSAGIEVVSCRVVLIRQMNAFGSERTLVLGVRTKPSTLCPSGHDELFFRYGRLTLALRRVREDERLGVGRSYGYAASKVGRSLIRR